MRFKEFDKLNEGMFMKDEILQRLLKWQTSPRLQYGLKKLTVGGKNFGSIPSASINTVFNDLGLKGIGYSSGTMNYKPMARAAAAADALIDRVAPNTGGPSRSLKRAELAGFADALYDWYKFAHQRMAAGVNIHDMQQASADAEKIGQLATGNVTEAPLEKKLPPTKKEIEQLRKSTQAGKLGRREAWALKRGLDKVISKYAKGDDWDFKNQYLDSGVYYVGDDLAEAERVGKEIIGALYGFFQDGARRSVTKLKRDEDANMMTFTAIPTPDKWGDRNPPQVSFTLHKNIQPGGPVIAVNINAAS